MILEENTEKFKNIQSQKNEDKHHPGSTIVYLRYMAKNVDGKCRFVVKVPNHNSKTCPECSRIMVIQRPINEEPAKEGTSDADPVSLNNSCGRKRRNVICGTCGGNHYRKTPCWSRNL